MPEVERVLKMICSNFRKSVGKLDITRDDTENDESYWLSLDKVYPGIMAHETIQKMVPHERESFLTRCRNWYREAITQIKHRIDLSDPVLHAMKDINHHQILQDAAANHSSGQLAKCLPQLPDSCTVQDIDREWHCLLVDDNVKTEH